jgi:hypothetical protein
LRRSPTYGVYPSSSKRLKVIMDLNRGRSPGIGGRVLMPTPEEGEGYYAFS